MSEGQRGQKGEGVPQREPGAGPYVGRVLACFLQARTLGQVWGGSPQTTPQLSGRVR